MNFDFSSNDFKKLVLKHLNTLNIPHDVDFSVSDIQRAYRTMANYYHPDKNSSIDSNKKMSEINNSKEFLVKYFEQAKLILNIDHKHQSNNDFIRRQKSQEEERLKKQREQENYRKAQAEKEAQRRNEEYERARREAEFQAQRDNEKQEQLRREKELKKEKRRQGMLKRKEFSKRFVMSLIAIYIPIILVIGIFYFVYNNKLEEGYELGIIQGYDEGLENGKAEGYLKGYDEIYKLNHEDGYEAGYQKGYEEGLIARETELKEEGFLLGFQEGSTAAYLSYIVENESKFIDLLKTKGFTCNTNNCYKQTSFTNNNQNQWDYYEIGSFIYERWAKGYVEETLSHQVIKIDLLKGIQTAFWDSITVDLNTVDAKFVYNFRLNDFKSSPGILRVKQQHPGRCQVGCVCS